MLNNLEERSVRCLLSLCTYAISDGQIQTAFFDVPLKMNFHEASKAGSRYDLRTILSNTIVQTKPGDAVTFVDNHE